MAELQIQYLSNPDTIVALWPELCRIPMIGITPEFVMSKALEGTYDTIVALCDGIRCGFMMYHRNQDVLTVIALYLPNHSRDFIDKFDDWCRSLGIKRYFATSGREPKAYARLLGLDYMYGVFGKEVI